MSKSEQIQSILDGWRQEYNVAQPVEFVGWGDMDEGGEAKIWTARCARPRNERPHKPFYSY